MILVHLKLTVVQNTLDHVVVHNKSSKTYERDERHRGRTRVGNRDRVECAENGQCHPREEDGRDEHHLLPFIHASLMVYLRDKARGSLNF